MRFEKPKGIQNSDTHCLEVQKIINIFNYSINDILENLEFSESEESWLTFGSWLRFRSFFFDSAFLCRYARKNELGGSKRVLGKCILVVHFSSLITPHRWRKRISGNVKSSYKSKSRWSISFGRSSSLVPPQTSSQPITLTNEKFEIITV